MFKYVTSSNRNEKSTKHWMFRIFCSTKLKSLLKAVTIFIIAFTFCILFDIDTKIQLQYYLLYTT